MTRSPRALVLLAAACAAAFPLVLALAYWTGPGRWADGAALQGFGALRVDPLVEPARFAAHLADPLPYGIAAAALALAALARGGVPRALAVAIPLGGSAVSSQALKDLLAHPRQHEFLGWAQIAPDAFPSGHATASMALALALVAVAPPAWRPLAAAAGGAFALAVSLSILLLAWHFPSDVVGGYLVATGWCAAALAALRWVEARRGARAAATPAAGAPPRWGRGPLAAAGLLLAAFALAGALLILAAAPSAGDLVEYARRHTAAVFAGAAISLAAAALVATLTLATRR